MCTRSVAHRTASRMARSHGSRMPPWYNRSMDDARLWPLFVVGAVGLAAGLWPLWWMVRRAGRRLGSTPQPPVAASRYVMALVVGIVGISVGISSLSLVVMLQ